VAVTTLLEREWTPTPHEVEHWVQSANAETTQSTGQAWVLQAWVLVRTGHALPPKRTARLMLRMRACDPPPQVWEQAFQAPHALTVQSTGQLSALHFDVSMVWPHATPPWAAAVTTDLVCDLKPPPQVREQEPQAL
jgi:hypothetical protein